MYEDLDGMHLALSLIFIYHFYLYFITLLSHRLNSLAVCVTSWICGPQLPKRVRNSCSGIDRCVLLNCCYRKFKSPSVEKYVIILWVMVRCFLSRGYDPVHTFILVLCNVRGQKSEFRRPKLVPHKEQLIIIWHTMPQNTKHNLWRWYTGFVSFLFNRS